MTGDPAEAAAPPTRRAWWALSWPVVGLFAVLVYEATTTPWLAALTLALKVAWDDLRAAVWLRRRDPHPPRGKAHFWLYLAFGLSKASLVGFALAMMIVFATVPMGKAARANRPANPPPDIRHAATAASMVFLAGMILSPAAGTVAVWHALRGGTRVWLSPGVYVAREKDVWPPWYGRKNRVGWVVAPTLFAGLTVVWGLMIWAVVAVGFGGDITKPACIGLCFGFPVALLIARDRLAPLLAAESPYDVWPEPPAPADEAYNSSDRT